ncbi:MAG: LLM class flavin-dependent oxidoreductase [Acidimicrobiales bacterium]
MELGVCIASKIDDLDYVVRAEQLGFSHAWFADSQMIWSDVFATMALAADRTTSIKIGTGVAVAATRPAPVVAAAMATINQLAPGRTFCGIGTGNTAMRIMGHKPMRIAEFETYLQTLGPLLRGHRADLHWRNDVSPVQHLMPTQGFVNFADQIPLYVSGFGPRSIALAATYGDGAVLSIPPFAERMERVWAGLLRAGEAAGRTLTRATFPTCTLSTIVVLDDGEPIDSERAKEQCGAFAVASLHYAYEQWSQFGRAPSGPILDFWPEYTALLDQISPEERHLRIHEGHNCWVVEEEKQFITKELIEATCLVGTADQIVERLNQLDEAGLDQLMILPPFDPRFDVIERVGAEIIPRLTTTTAP